MTQEPRQTPETAPAQAAADDELLLDGQEEVFARTEVERGMIEHHSLEEDVPEARAPDQAPPQEVHRPHPVEPEQQMAENFRAQFDPRP